MRAGAGTQPQQRMLEQRQQRDRLQPLERRLDNEPREHAGRRIGERVTAGVVDRDVPARERGEHAARQRPVGRHQRRGLAVGLEHLAQRDRDRERFFLGVRRRDHRHMRERVVEPQAALGKLAPLVGGVGGPHHLRDDGLAAVRRRLAEPADLVARDADPPQQRLHGELRMADGGRDDRASVGVAPAGDVVPRRLVEIGVEAGQHHGAMRELRDRLDQGRGRRHRAGGAGRDHGTAGVRGEPLGFGGDQQVAPLGGLDPAALGEDRRPGVAHDLVQEAQRELPVFVVLARHQRIELVPRHLPRGHVVHQPRQRVGERQRRCRIVGDQRCAALAADRLRRRPSGDELCQQQPALEPAELVGEIERARVGDVGEHQLVLVDVADRDDARQDRGVGAGGVEEEVARQPAGAPCRQVDRGGGERERIAGIGKALDQGAVAQRADQRRHEWRRGWNGEDARRRNRHANLVSCHAQAGIQSIQVTSAVIACAETTEHPAFADMTR